MSNRPIETAAKPHEESPACDVCGQTGAVEIADRVLCPECYQGCGSCCSDIDQSSN
jgi:hypothetical protein